jgi:DNA-binding protein HU-beta
MTTADIIKSLAHTFDKPQTEIKKILSSTVNTLREQLVNHTKFTLPGFGTFSMAKRKERKAYNPHYKSMTLLPQKVVAVFRPSKNLKEKVR